MTPDIALDHGIRLVHLGAMAVIGDGSTPRAEKVQKISAIREQTIAKVRALLNDDQKKKLDQMNEALTETITPSTK